MNNEELKKKICEIIAPYVSAWGEDERIADALIAAGIGDVKERKFEADHYWSMWQGSLVELERAEHRAEVAERALFDFCKKMLAIPSYMLAVNEVERLLKQAEKELAEERKDD